MCEKRKPSEQAFFALARCGADATAIALLRELSPRIDWHEVCDMAVKNGIAGLVSSSIERFGPYQLPRDVVRRFAVQRMITESRNQVFVEEVTALSREASKKNVALVSIKGVGLFNGRPYSDISLRMSSDMDLVARRSEFGTVEKILEDFGYQASERKEFELRHEHHVQFFKPHKSGTLTVELHWTPFYSMFSESELDDAALKRAGHFCGQDVEIEFLDLEDTLISLLLHLAMHRFRGQLKWVVDIAELLRAFEHEIKWEIVEERARKLGSLRVVDFGLWLAGCLLGAPTPSSFVYARGLRWKCLKKLNPSVGYLEKMIQPSMMKRTVIDLVLRDKFSDSFRHVVLKAAENQERRYRIMLPGKFLRRGLNSN